MTPPDANISGEKNEVEVKNEVIKNVNMNVSKNENECQRMIDIGQSEVGPVNCCVRVMSPRNGPSGLTDLERESLQTNNKKPTFKCTQTSNSNSPSTSRKINNSRNILPTVFTPTKRKLLEAKTVKNLIS